MQSNNLIYVTGYNNGANVYDPILPPFVNTLKEVEDGFGYWVRVQNADVLQVSGTCIVENYRTAYNSGWNLVAYPANSAQAVSSYYNNLISLNGLLYVTGFNNGTFTFDPTLPPFVNTLSNLENGFGYWVKIVDNNIAKKSSNTTNIFNFIGGICNLSTGEFINVQKADGGTVAVLEVLQDGYLKIAPVYGDDSTTDIKEGLNIGEELSFSWNNETAITRSIFKGDLGIDKVNLSFKTANEVENELQVNVYPVPTQHIIYFEVETPVKGSLVIQIIDNNGNLVKSIKRSTSSEAKQAINFDVAHLPNGIYNYKITTGKLEKVGKFEVLK